MSRTLKWLHNQNVKWNFHLLDMTDWLKDTRQKIQSKSTYNKFFPWSFLATYGNNPVVKLSILAPLFAQILIHKDTVAFLQQYDFTKLKWLYFSLMCFFFAQLIYNFICHRDIKDYPSEIKFTQAMEVTTSDEDLNRDYFNVYKKHFKRYGGILRVANSAVPSEVVKSPARDKIWYEVVKIFRSMHFDEQTLVIEWKCICKPKNEKIVVQQFESLTKQAFGDIHIKTVQDLRWEARSEMLGSHWRAKAIKRRYDRLNTDEVIARYTAGIFYFVGSIYFIVTGTENILRVIGKYG